MANPFKKAPTAVQTIPEPTPPAPMPDTSSPGVLEAKKRAQQQLMSSGGRVSTILTAPKDRAGGGAYTAVKLGVDA
jgi:hypothetical protein